MAERVAGNGAVGEPLQAAPSGMDPAGPTNRVSKAAHRSCRSLSSSMSRAARLSGWSRCQAWSGPFTRATVGEGRDAQPHLHVDLPMITSSVCVQTKYRIFGHECAPAEPPRRTVI